MYNVCVYVCVCVLFLLLRVSSLNKPVGLQSLLGCNDLTSSKQWNSILYLLNNQVLTVVLFWRHPPKNPHTSFLDCQTWWFLSLKGVWSVPSSRSQHPVFCQLSMLQELDRVVIKHSVKLARWHLAQQFFQRNSWAKNTSDCFCVSSTIVQIIPVV